MTSIKSKADWEAVERSWSVGVLSVRELGRNYGLDDKSIRNRAKKYGWKRDLAERVRAAAEDQIARRDGADEPASPQAHRARAREMADNLVVADAAKRISDVVLTHRADIQRLAQQKRSILDRLDRKRSMDADVEAGLKEPPKDWEPLSLGMEAKILETVARIEAKIIPLERQAHSLDSKAGKTGEGENRDGRPKPTYFVVPTKQPIPPAQEPATAADKDACCRRSSIQPWR